jgi:hypothetical protein
LKDNDRFTLAKYLTDTILGKNGDALSGIISGLYADLPPALPVRRNNENDSEFERKLKESFYHTILWSYCGLVLYNPQAEVPGSNGDPNLTLVLNDGTIVLLEIRYALDTGQETVKAVLKNLANDALKAIKDKGYADKYLQKGEKLVTIGVGVFGTGQALAIFGDSTEKDKNTGKFFNN